MTDKTFSVLVPVYNEESTIEEITGRIIATGLAHEIVIVDDRSTDSSWEKIQKIQGENPDLVKAVRCDKNMGKGAAIRTGLEHITGDYILIQDADLEYDPEDYPKLMQPVLKGKAEVVYGSRFTGEHRNMFYWHLLGNKFLTMLTNVLYNTTISDMETGYKLFRTDIIKSIRIRSNKFDFEPEITSKLLKRGVRIYEVPISYAGREFDEGKKITWRDGFWAVLALVRYRFTD